VNFHHEGLEPASNAMERSANGLSFALVVGALIIGSSLIIHAQVPPLWAGVSALGLLGYVLARGWHGHPAAGDSPAWQDVTGGRPGLASGVGWWPT
jgi:hypothetical protein